MALCSILHFDNRGEGLLISRQEQSGPLHETETMLLMKIPDPLTTDRLIVRPYEEDDFAAFYDFLSDPEATRFLRFTPEQKTPEGARAFFDLVLESYTSIKPIVALAIVHRATTTYIGSCGLTALADGTGVECYYVLLPRYWGSGYAVEAASALFDFAFSELRIDRILAVISPENQSSLRVAERLGMEDQGLVFDREVSEYVYQFVLWAKDINA